MSGIGASPGGIRAAMWAALLVTCAAARADLLPLRTYSVEHGLAGETVHAIVRDSRGFLWFATSEGLTRFDGQRMFTYGAADGLPHPAVNDVLEGRDGSYWLATTAGLCRLVPTAEGMRAETRRFGPGFRENIVRFVFEDRQGRIWIGTRHGLVRFDGERFRMFGVAIRREPAVAEPGTLCGCEPSNRPIGSRPPRRVA